MLRILSEVLLSVLLRVFHLIFGCALSGAKASLKLGVSIASCNGKCLVDAVTVVTVVPFLLDTIWIKGMQREL